MIIDIVELLGSVIALVGWFGYHSTQLLLIGTVGYLIYLIAQWRNLNSNAKGLEVFIFIVGSIVFLIRHKPFWIGGLVALNIYSLIMSVITVIVLILSGIGGIAERRRWKNDIKRQREMLVENKEEEE